MLIVFAKLNIRKISDNDLMNKGVYDHVIRFGVYMFLIMETNNLIWVADCLWIPSSDTHTTWDNAEVDPGISYIQKIK